MPDADSRKDKRRIVEEIVPELKTATSASAKASLARGLLSMALTMTNDPPSCYVCLSIAGSLALEARKYGCSLEVIKALDEHFDVNALRLRTELIAAIDAGTKTPGEQKWVARLLLRKASDLTNDPRSGKILLNEAGRLAFKARDYDLSLEAIDALEKQLGKDVLSLRIAIMAAEDKDPETPWEDRYSLGVQLMAEAAAKERLDVLVQMGQLTQKAAEQSGPSLIGMPSLVKYFGRYRSSLEKALQAKIVLKNNPADPEANLVLGKLYCFERRDWEKGIPLLALGGDVRLKQLAEKEKQDPTDNTGRLDLGDGWWELAQENATAEKTALLARAAHWYRLALPKLVGLSQVKAQKRLAEIPPHRLPPRERGDLAGFLRPGSLRAPSLRRIAVKAGGGTIQSERAVQAALVWLAKHQLSDGRWSLQDYTTRCTRGDRSCTGQGDVRSDSGATAMALLPFLAAGQTHKSKGPYKEQILKGTNWLVQHQMPDGNLAKGAGLMRGTQFPALPRTTVL